MTLGEKLRAARQAAGLSQRQLAQDTVTRNMLSQIEHDTARPSMDTLKTLARRLELPVSYFLEEDVVTSANQALMARARECQDAQRWQEIAELLRDYREPDPVYDREYRLLRTLARLGAGEQALREDRPGYARQLLEEPVPEDCYCAGELERRRILLRSRLPGARRRELTRLLPDAELLLRAEAALETGEPAGILLDLARDRESPRWQLLRGRAYAAEGAWEAAIPHLRGAEEAYPLEAARELERCYRELEDYRMAYHYACRLRP